MKTGKFQVALDAIESLDEEERESLLEIVRKRIIEERRDRHAQSISEARREYESGKIRKGSVDELMREIAE